MGCDLRQPVHVELYGLPGSGKSATARMLAEGLRTQGYEVREPSAEIDGQGDIWRIIKKAVYTGGFYLSHPGIWKEMWGRVYKNGYTSLRTGLPQMVNIAQKFRIYCGNVSSYIYVWDEGLVQAAISLSVGGTVSSEENMQWLNKVVPDKLLVIKIYLDTPIDIVKCRLINRSGGRSRVEKESNAEKKEELLLKFEQACNEIENPDCIIKAGDMAVEEITCLIQSQIERSLLSEAIESFSDGD